MIDPEMRNAIYQLHLAGRPLREISRQFQVSRNTVRAIIRQQGAVPHPAGGQAHAAHRQSAVPAVLEAPVPEVLSRVQPLRHEVLLP